MQALIWDLDGTLIDSYEVIIESMVEVFAEYGIALDAEAVHQFVIRSSGGAFLRKMEAERGISAKEAERRHAEISAAKLHRIPAIRHAREVLAILSERGIRSFIHTHRNESTYPILKNLGLDGFFEAVITSADGFARKPDPAASLWLLEHYHLDPAQTGFVGDRELDMECARRAGLCGILYLEPGSVGNPTGAETHIVHDLLDIAKLV